MSARPSVLAGLAPVADIVATVDLERALRDLGEVAPGSSGVVADPLLGATVVVVDRAGDADLPIALAEPTTEGRLAATLARHGEGPAGRYVMVADGDSLDSFRRRAAGDGVVLSRVEDGPFGPSVLVLAGAASGPHLIVVEARSLPSAR
jgi:hypothetical protein